MIDFVWKVFKKMGKLGVVVNIYLYNVLVYVCFKFGDFERVEKLLSEMEERGVFFDFFIYNMLILVYCRKGMYYEVLLV